MSFNVNPAKILKIADLFPLTKKLLANLFQYFNEHRANKMDKN